MANVSRSTPQPSPARRASLYSTDVPTFAELIERAQSDDTLTSSRRANITSSLRRLAAALGKDVDTVHAYPPTLRPLLKDLHPFQLGISRKRWQNIRADAAFALRYASHGSYLPQQISNTWRTLKDALPAWRDKASISRFARWCSSQGIEPHDVDDRTLIAYEEALIRGTYAEQPRCNVHLVVQAWNRALPSVPGWPQSKLVAPHRNKPFVPSEAELSPQFRDDLDRWIRHLSGADILADQALDEPWRPASIASSRYLARYLWAALVASGRDPEQIVGLADLVQPGALRSALQYCLDRAEGVVTAHIGKLASVARQIAKRWTKSSSDDLARIGAMTRKLIRAQNGMTERNRKQLLQIDDPKNLQALLDFPRMEMESAIKHDDGSVRAALRVQLAVAIEILLMAPIQLTNLASLEIGRSYIRSCRNGSYKAHLIFETDEVKNAVPLKFDLPEESVRLIDLYLVRFHHRITRSSPFLFPGHTGSKDTKSLSEQVSKRLFKVLGLRIHVHLFRHIAAKIYLDRHPHAFEFVRQLLGHKNIQTTMTFYAQFSRTAAAQHYDSIVLGLRTGDQQGMPR